MVVTFKDSYSRANHPHMIVIFPADLEVSSWKLHCYLPPASRLAAHAAAPPHRKPGWPSSSLHTSPAVR